MPRPVYRQLFDEKTIDRLNISDAKTLCCLNLKSVKNITWLRKTESTQHEIKKKMVVTLGSLALMLLLENDASHTQQKQKQKTIPKQNSIESSGDDPKVKTQNLIKKG